MKYAFLFSVIAALVFMGVSAGLAGAEEKPFDNFESLPVNWASPGWENIGGVDLELSTDKASEGKQSLMVTAQDEPQDWKNRVVIAREAVLDLSNENMVMDIYTDVATGMGVQVGFDSAGDYYESEKKILSQGWNKGITFDLGAKDFKCKASEWK
ncbi:MAG: hypothetical protein PHR22_02110, partial [Candidatus Omnitrophica bacterium]|nr:hypothetical protein [Candidatus Omnitrophota bacterium]